MTKHSKNNTASSIFSYAEYKKLEYGTKKQRLGNESMRSFDACALCLNRAREPLACADGHLFCKECIYTDLLAQKKDIKRQKDRLEALKKEAEEERARARQAARERVLRDFERGQLSLSVTEKPESKSTEKVESRGTKRKTPPPPDHSPDPSSLSVSFSSTTVQELALKAEEVAMKQLEVEQTAALKHKLPDFWLPSLTPTHSASVPQSLAEIDAGVKKLQTTCRGGGKCHSIALKSLIPVKFTQHTTGAGSSEGSKKEDAEAMCPSCKKRLSNNILLFISKPCGHVTCKTCTDTLVKPSKQCIVCETTLKEKDIIELKREGTGFAGGGLAETSKAGVAFQG